MEGPPQVGSSERHDDSTANQGNQPQVVVNFNGPVNFNFGTPSGALPDEVRRALNVLGLGFDTAGRDAFQAAEQARQVESRPQGVIEDADKHPELNPASVRQAVADTLTPEREEQWEIDAERGVKDLLEAAMPRELVGFDGLITKKWLREFAENNDSTSLAGSQLYGVFGRFAFREALARRGVELPLGDNDGYRPEDVAEVAKLGEEFVADPEVRTFGKVLNNLLQTLAEWVTSQQAAFDEKERLAAEADLARAKKTPNFTGAAGQQRLVDVALKLGLSEAAGNRTWNLLDSSQELRDFCADNDRPFPPLGTNNAFRLKDLRELARLEGITSVKGFGAKSQAYKVLTAL